MSCKKRNQFLIDFSIIILSIGFFCLFHYSNINSPMADDNVFQWEPITERIFERIFSGKSIPFYDFFQFKGFDVFSSGYYGQLNPFMYIAYAISRYAFGFKVKTLVVYIIIMYCLGNVFMYRLLSKLKISRLVTILSVLTYSSSLFFFIYEFYYFTFNNYFFIPFFLYILYTTKKTVHAWYIPGIILASSMLLGHVQYTSYYIIVYCIIQCVFSAQEKGFQPFFQMLTGLSIFCCLNSAYFFTMLTASAQRSNSGLDSSFFLDDFNLKYLFRVFDFIHNKDDIQLRYTFQSHVGLGILSFICLTLIINNDTKTNTKKIYDSIDRILHDRLRSKRIERLQSAVLLLLFFGLALYVASDFQTIGEYTDYIILLLFIGISILYLYVLLYKRKTHTTIITVQINRILFSINLLLFTVHLFFYLYIFLPLSIIVYLFFRNQKSTFKTALTDKEFISSLCFAALFFITLGCGKDQKLANFMYMIPVFNQFRFLYKCAFIFIPLIIIIAAFRIDNFKELKLHKLYYFSASLLIICFVISVSNILYTINSGYHTYINDRTNYDYYDIDSDNLAIAEKIKDLNIDKNYRFLTCSSKPIDSEIGLSNIEYASKTCSYTLSKNFNTYHSVFTLSGYDSLFSSDSFHQSDSIITDLYYEYHMSNQASGLMFKQNNTDDLHDQLVKNSVKYILYPKNQPEYYEQFNKYFKKYKDLKITRNEEWIKDYMLLEIEGVNPICMDAKGNKINIDATIDEISIQTNFTEPTAITFSITYAKGLVAELSNDASDKSTIEVTKDHNNYTTIIIPSGDYKVTLKEKNYAKTAVILCSLITFLLTVASLIVIHANPIISNKVTQ